MLAYVTQACTVGWRVGVVSPLLGDIPPTHRPPLHASSEHTLECTECGCLALTVAVVVNGFGCSS